MDSSLCLTCQGLCWSFINHVLCCEVTELDAESMWWCGGEGHSEFHCHPKCLFYCIVLEQDTEPLSAHKVLHHLSDTVPGWKFWISKKVATCIWLWLISPNCWLFLNHDKTLLRSHTFSQTPKKWIQSLTAKVLHTHKKFWTTTTGNIPLSTTVKRPASRYFLQCAQPHLEGYDFFSF